MDRRGEPLHVTLEELKARGFEPVVTKGKHWKVKCAGLPLIIVSGTSNDPYAANAALKFVRRVIAQNTR